MSTEAVATIVRATLGLIGAMIICLIFVWKLGLICLLFMPFALAGHFLGVKLQKNEILNDAEEIQANSLASDAISNYRTVAAYGLDTMIAKEFSELIVGPVNKNLCNAHLIGLSFGYSQLMANVSLIFYLVIGAVLQKDDDTISGFHIFICSFVFIFASQTASNAQSYGPDITKAFLASVKIFTLMFTPTKINAIDEPPQKLLTVDHFQGEIEFKDVWFRYPSRPKQWVLKGFNLKIKANDCIAIVGESGQGKSTLINLLLRFYDVTFGEILIDGADIRSYDVRNLRA